MNNLREFSNLLQSNLDKNVSLEAAVLKQNQTISELLTEGLAKDVELIDLKNELKVLKSASERTLVHYSDLSRIKGNFTIESVKADEHMFASNYRWVTML